MAEKTENDGKIFVWLFLISLVAFGFYVYHWSTPDSLIRIDRGIQNGASTNAVGTNTETGRVRGEETTTKCLKRPDYDYDECVMFLGVYFSGSECEQIYGCDLNGDVPPFFSVGECQEACQSGENASPVLP